MKSRNKYATLYLLIIGAISAVLFVVDIALGSVSIPLSEVVEVLLGGEASKGSWQIIITDIRLPKACTAVLAGSALAVAGLQMQTLFRNPLAGPFVLGISSGASLGVALLVMAGSAVSSGFFVGGSLSGSWSMVVASVGGSFAVLALVMLMALRVKDSVTLLIVGLMFGSLTGALVSVLQHFSTPEMIDAYVTWTFGSLKGVTWVQLSVLFIVVGVGMSLAFLLHKRFDALLLGDAYAQSLGVAVGSTRLLTIISTSLLAGSITAFCGPIAFIGLAVPHIVRAVLKTSKHSILLPGSLLTGAAIMLVCDGLAELPGLAQTLPINAVTALFGAPVVIAVILRNRNLRHAF